MYLQRNVLSGGSIASVLLTVCMVLSVPADGFALKQYRCDGRVQFRPCGDEIAGPRIISESKTSRRRAPDRDPISENIPGERFARVDDPTYSQMNGTTGMWRGRIQGNGKIALVLQILQNGNLIEARQMGETYLMNASTTFAFTSPIPRTAGWSWNVVAKAS